MTIDEAVAVLNERRHSGYGNWRAGPIAVSPWDSYSSFSHFEAIAVAEHYTRNPPPLHESTPVPGWLVVWWDEFGKKWVPSRLKESRSLAEDYVSEQTHGYPHYRYRVVQVTEASR